MISFLPLIVGNRIKTVGIGTLKQENLKSWNDPVFITGKTLFIKESNSYLITPEDETFPDVSFEISGEKKIIVDGVTIYTIEIDIKKEDNEKKDTEKENNGETVLRKDDFDSLKLMFRDDISLDFNNGNWIGIKIKFKYENEEGHLLIINGKDESVFENINMDLGSESTQITYAYIDKQNYGAKFTTHINIIDRIKKGLKLDIDNIFQKDESDGNLFVTGNMLVKKTGGRLSNYKSDNNIFRLISKIEDFAAKQGDQSYSSWEKDNDNITNISNPKLAYLAGEYILSGININGSSLHFPENTKKILNHIYKTFIQIAVESFDKQFFRVVLLVPNIYDQGKIREVVENLNKSFNETFVLKYFYNEDKETEKNNNKTIECFVISESDAALISSVNNRSGKNEFKENSKVLIVDSGRGTTDFSILHFEDRRNFSCMNRGGIIGGGQYLTNTFIKAVGAIICEVCGSDMLNDFYENITTAVGQKKNDFINFFEKIKKRRITREDLHELSRRISLGDSCNTDKVIEKISKIDSENNKIIQEDIKILVNKIIDGILSGKKILKGIDYIYFTGRAFLFEPYKELFEKSLKEKVFRNKFLFWKRYPKIFFDKNNSKTIAVKLPNIIFFKSNENSNLATTFFKPTDNESFYEGFNDENGDVVFYVGEQTRSSLVTINNEERKFSDYLAEKNLANNIGYFELLSVFVPGIKLKDDFKYRLLEDIKKYSKCEKSKEDADDYIIVSDAEEENINYDDLKIIIEDDDDDDWYPEIKFE